MTINRTEIRIALSIFLASSVLCGCGDGKNFGRRYRVTGSVAYKGEPLNRGTITFSPEDPAGRVALGEIDASGNYRLSTISPDDGALPGKYRVTVSSTEIDRSQLKANFAPDAPIPQHLAMGAPQKSLIPTKYQSPETSGLTAEVAAHGNTIDFPLTD